MAGWEVDEVGEVLNEVSIINMSQCVWPDVYQQGVVRYIKPTALQIAPQLTLPPVWSSLLSPVKFVIRVFMLSVNNQQTAHNSPDGDTTITDHHVMTLMEMTSFIQLSLIRSKA